MIPKNSFASLPTDSTPAPLRAVLLAECRRRQQEKADVARQAMEDVQASANEHNGAMEDKFESFRESCQIQRDLFARQLDEALTGLAILHRLEAESAPQTHVGLGALVQTDRGARFFIAISLGPVPDPAGGAPWLAVSTHSPIGQAMLGRQAGETFSFRGEQHRVERLL